MTTRPNRRGVAAPVAGTALAAILALSLAACGATGGDRTPADGQTPTDDTALSVPESTPATEGTVDPGDDSTASASPDSDGSGDSGDSGDSDSADVDVTLDPGLAEELAELEALAEQIDQQLRDAAAAAANGG